MTQDAPKGKAVKETFPPDVQVSEDVPVPGDNEPSKFLAFELLDETVAITGGEYERPYAAGALKHAGIHRRDMITRESFLEALNNFKSAQAF